MPVDPCEEPEFFCSDCDASAIFQEDADEDGPCGSIVCNSCDARKKGEITLDLIEDIELGGIDHRDAPDYVDAFIASAKWINYPKDTDPELTEEQLGRISSEGTAEYVQQKLNM